MKKTVFFAALLALSAFAETNSIDWRYGRPGVRVVTNAPSVALFTAEVARVEARIDGIGFAGTSHSVLSNLSWTAGGHYGTPARLAGFFEGGMAGYAGFGPGMYLDGDDNIAVSNDIITGAALGATSLQPDATNAVTVATDAKLALKMNITGGSSTNQILYSPTVTNKLAFGTSYAAALALGEVAWDTDWQTMRIGLGSGVTGQNFQESHIYAKNVSGQTVTNGMIVRYSGAVGNSGKCEFVLAKAEPGIRPATTLGIATHDIANGEFGKITWFGNVNGIDTTGALYGETGWTNNMIVFMSTNTPGFLTRFEPQAPNPRISVGVVINRHANAGTILVRPTWGSRITEADDVNGTPLSASGQIMVWDAARGVFDFTDNIGNYVSEAEGISRLKDSRDTNVFQTVENGTGTVWRISVVTNYQVTLSADFLETGTPTRPAWTNHVWPFNEADWTGDENALGEILEIFDPSGDARWASLDIVYPVTLSPSVNAQGTAVVSQLVSYVTNAISTYATDARVTSVESDVAAIALTTNQVTLNPYVKTLYADLATTNTTGYAGFLTNNAIQQSITLCASGATETNTAWFTYPISCNTYGARSVFYASVGGAADNTGSCTLWMFNANGTPVVSNTVNLVYPRDDINAHPYFTNSIVFSAVTSGSIRVSVLLGKSGSVRDNIVLAGGDTPSSLSLNVRPLNYATIAETDAKYPLISDGTMTNPVFIGSVTIGGESRSNWPSATSFSTRYAISNAVTFAGESFLVLTNSPSTNALQTVVVAGVTNGQYLIQGVSEPFGSSGTIGPGEAEGHFHAITTTIGGDSCTVRPELYLVDSNGAVKAEWDANAAVALPGTDSIGLTIPIYIPVPIKYEPTDRRQYKLRAVVANSAPTVTIYLEDAKQFSIGLPVPSSFFASQNDLAAKVDKTSGTASNLSVTGTLTLNGNSVLTNASPGVLLSFLTNSLGITTQQVWNIGGSVSTNFFSRAGCQVPKTGVTVTQIVGDDGYWQAGVISPNPLYEIQPGDLTVKDNVTGLYWTKNCNLISNTVWAAANGTADWTNAVSFATNLNAIAYGGRTDWRLPNRNEFFSLVNKFQWLNPAVSDATGTNQWTEARGPWTNLRFDVVLGRYWTSTPYAGALSLYAWHADLAGFYSTSTKVTFHLSLYCAGP